MKVAIPADEMNIGSNVCVSFGRTPYFMLYDTNTNESTFLENSAAGSQGGAGIKAAQLIADSGASVLLTPRCGENAAEVLTRSEVAIYKTIPGTLSQNIEAYNAGSLLPLSEIHPGFHGHAQ